MSVASVDSWTRSGNRGPPVVFVMGTTRENNGSGGEAVCGEDAISLGYQGGDGGKDPGGGASRRGCSDQKLATCAFEDGE